MSSHFVSCPLCGGRDIGPLFKSRDFHYGNPGEFTLAHCARCNLAFLDPMYDDAELAVFYAKTYYSFRDRFQSPSPSRPVRERITKMLGVRGIHTSRDPEFDRPGRMLDVGCGSGWFLSKMRAQGWDVKGVEP